MSESTPPRDPVGRSAEAPGPGPAVRGPALQGDLSHFFPAEVLQLLQLAQATGRLMLTRSDPRASRGYETVDVFFESGRPVFARTGGQSVRTGEVLLHRGQLAAESLERALEEQRRGPGRRIGRLLIETGAAPREQVARAVHEGQRRILYGVLLWGEGSFRFLAGERIEDNDMPLDLDLDRLILEGLRMADQARPPASGPTR